MTGTKEKNWIFKNVSRIPVSKILEQDLNPNYLNSDPQTAENQWKKTRMLFRQK